MANKDSLAHSFIRQFLYPIFISDNYTLFVPNHLKQVGIRPGGRCDKRSSRTDYRLWHKLMYSTIR